MTRAMLAVALLGAIHAWLPRRANACSGTPPVNVRFITPGGPTLDAEYRAAIADTSIRVAWEDGDIDQRSVLDFYALPFQPHTLWTADEIIARAIALREIDGSVAQRWASCTCVPDARGDCPDAGVRNCTNALVWDTHEIPTGAYFVIAVNRDPPLRTLFVSDGPIVVAHGPSNPPAVVVLRPDGIGTFDRTAEISWWAVGAPPLRTTLAFGRSEGAMATATLTALDVPVEGIGRDLYRAAWDISTLPPGRYFVRVSVTDQNGARATSETRYTLTVYHPPLVDGGASSTPADLAVDGPPRAEPKPGGCSAAPSASSRAPSVVAMFVVAILVVWRVRRRSGRVAL